MTKPGSIEWKIGKFALAHPTFLQVLEANGITEAHDVRAHISCEQHSFRTPQQRDLSGAMPGDMNYVEATRDLQCFPWDQRLVYGNGIQSLFGMEEQVAQNSPEQTRSASAKGNQEWLKPDRNLDCRQAMGQPHFTNPRFRK